MQSTAVQTCLALLDTYKNFDIPANVALRTPTCTHTMLPASSGFPVMDIAAFTAHITMLSHAIIGFDVTPVKVFDGGKVVTIHATSETVWRPEVIDDGVDWRYHGEYIFVMEMNEAGDKVESVIEFVDSAAVANALVLLQKAMGNLEAKKGKT
jgi:hypothetical protein